MVQACLNEAQFLKWRIPDGKLLYKTALLNVNEFLPKFVLGQHRWILSLPLV